MVQESAKSMFSIFEDLAKLRSFHRTRSAARAGENLASLSKEAVTKHGMLGPWTLNIYESVLVALPSVVILGTLDIIRHPVEQADQIEAVRVAEKLVQYVRPLIVPFGLMFFSWIAGWSSFHKNEGTKEAKRHAKYSYLYLDGSFGLLPQTLTVTALSIFLYMHKTLDFYDHAGSLGFVWIVMYVGVLWNIFVNFREIPSRLFAFNGYSSDKPKLFRFGLPGDHPGPWIKYEAAMIFIAGWGFTLLTLLLGVVCGVLGGLIASLKTP